MSKGLMGLCPAAMLILSVGAAGCNWNRSGLTSDEAQRQRDEKTREEVAKATERLKPMLESAGRKLGEATESAAEDAHAAAQGVKEGRARGSHRPVDLNSASEKELMELSGITGRDARRIFHARPYRDKRELVSKGILSNPTYSKIQDQITVK